MIFAIYIYHFFFFRFIPLWYPYTSYFFSKRSQKDTELNIPEVKDVDSKKDSKDSKESKPLTSDSKELTYCEKLKEFFKMPFTVYVYDHVKHLKKILIFN